MNTPHRFAVPSWTHAVAVAVVVAVTGCGTPEDKQKSEPPAKWEGATPHFRAVGTLNGEEVDVRIEGDAAADTARLFCQREYVVQRVNGDPDWSTGKVEEVKLNAPLSVGGEERYFELELKKHDLQRRAPGDEVSIVARVDDVRPSATEMWFEWEWHRPDGSTLFEAAAQSGTFTLGEFTGTPDSTGLQIPENTGTVGGFITARWSETDQLAITFTARCTRNSTVIKE